MLKVTNKEGKKFMIVYTVVVATCSVMFLTRNKTGYRRDVSLKRKTKYVNFVKNKQGSLLIVRDAIIL